MAVPRQIYDFFLDAIRSEDQRTGHQFLERYLMGPQSVWETNANILQTIPNLWSVTDCPDEFLIYLKNIVGWTKDLEHITANLTDDELRGLISVSGRLWKERGSEDTIQDVMYFALGARNRIWNWFDFRWVLDETEGGEEHQGRDPWVIALPDPDAIGSEYVSNLRIVDSGSLNQTLVDDLLDLMRAVPEVWEVTYLRFLDQFILDGDLSQWETGAYTVSAANGVMKVGTTVSDQVAWTAPSLGEEWLSQVISVRARSVQWQASNSWKLFFQQNATSGADILAGNDKGYSLTVSVSTDEIYLYRVDGGFTLLDSASIVLRDNVYYGVRAELAWEGVAVNVNVYVDANLVLSYKDYKPHLDIANDGVAIVNSGNYVDCDEVEVMCPIDITDAYASFADMAFVNSSVDRYGIAEDGLSGPHAAEVPIYSRVLNRLCVQAEGSVQNLATYSHQIDQYTKGHAGDTVNPNDTANPVGEVTADEMVPSTTSSSHLASRTATFTSGRDYTFAARVKNNGQGFAALVLPAARFVGSPLAIFDLDNVTVDTETNCVANIYPLNDDWFAVVCKATGNSTGSGSYEAGPAVSGATVFAGDGSSAIWVWGVDVHEFVDFLDSPIETVASAVLRNQDSYIWTPGNFSTSIGSQKHEMIWQPTYSSTDNQGASYRYLYELYNSATGTRLRVVWNTSTGVVELRNAAGTVIASCTAIAFSAFQTMRIILDPINGTLEVAGATSGGVTDTTAAWYTLFENNMSLYLGHSGTIQQHSFAKVCVPYPVT